LKYALGFVKEFLSDQKVLPFSTLCGMDGESRWVITQEQKGDPMSEMTALVTNADLYVGPDACIALREAGFNVACHSSGFLDRTFSQAFSDQHPGVLVLDEQSPEEVTSAVLAHFGKLDLLVNNHFRAPEVRPIESNSVDDYRQMLETLLVAPFAFARSVVPGMKQQRSGRIIMVTSAAPLSPSGYVSMYTSARGGANLLMRSLAKELAEFNIAAFSICPNFYQSKDTYSQEMFESNEQYREYIENNVPLKRLSRPEEMRDLVRFLATEHTDFITGQVFSFSGGWV
jgi:NAD(P)-dependent dehydrogenase (short-subunit alcohol dehydrogenase family)